MQIKELLKYTLDSGASDLHLSVGSIPSIRLNGEIKNLKLPVMDLPTMEGISKDILDKHELDNFEELLEMDFSYELKGSARFRVNIFKQINGISAVFRTINDSSKTIE